MGEDFKTGAWIGKVECGKCGKPSLFAMNFKKMGKHRMVACAGCMKVYLDGEEIETIDPPAA